jgi:phosphate transport system substrate-binding protein
MINVELTCKGFKRMNNNILYLRWIPVLVLLVVLIVPERVAFGENLVIPGTGACETILNELAKAFNESNPGENVIVPQSTGSGGGITAVIKGQANLARVARPLKDAEMKQGLVQQVFAKDAVAFVVGKDVKVKNLSSDQLTAIFSGKIENWKDVGGNTGPIRVIARESGDSSLIVIEEHIKEFRNITISPRAKVIMYDRTAVEALDKYKNSIGYITISSARWAKGGIKPIAKDSVAPTRENVLSGRYRLVEDYYFVYNKGSIVPLAKKFIDFVFSKEGRNVIERNSLIAVDRK